MTSQPDDILDLLTAYALNTLEPEEIAHVVKLLGEQPELRSVLAQLRATADQLPYALPEVEPPADLRQRVLDRATGRAQPVRQAAPTRPAGRARGWILALGSLAALAIIAVVFTWLQLTSVQSELARTQSDLVQARGELERTQTQQQQVVNTLLEAATIATLNDAGSGGNSGKLVRAADGRAVLAAQLPPLQAGRVYQLWLIQGQNAPVSAGTFKVDPQGHGLLTLTPAQQALAADTVAVTDEPDPGSPGPTTKILIVGKLPAA
jgi:anti-sigma-K factor RskA